MTTSLPEHSSSIVERLRRHSDGLYRRAGARKTAEGNWDCYHTEGYMLKEAAAEIERLSKELADLEREFRNFVDYIDFMEPRLTPGTLSRIENIRATLTSKATP